MVNVVARRHGINPSQLSQWRQDHQRDQLQTDCGAPDAHAQAGTAFVPVMVADTQVSPAAPNRAASAHPETGEIEITRGQVMVRVRGAVDPALLLLVLQALVGPS
jgi:transposase-like protein